MHAPCEHGVCVQSAESAVLQQPGHPGYRCFCEGTSLNIISTCKLSSFIIISNNIQYPPYLWLVRVILSWCPDGYTGYNCETDWDECWAGPCLNGGT